MSEQNQREAIVRAISKKQVVYRLPAMDALPSPHNLTYEATSGARLAMDAYYPLLPPGGRAPVVIAPLAFPDPEARVRMYGPLTSWATTLSPPAVTVPPTPSRSSTTIGANGLPPCTSR